MNQAIRNTQDNDRLDQVIEAYSASAGGPSYDSMLAWISRYPEYEREIIDFTVDWFMAEQTAPALDEEDTELTAEALQRHREVIQEIANKHITSQAGIESLLAEAKSRGISRKQLADSVRLTIPLIDKLDRRLIRYSSIPRAIIEALAQALSRQVDTVSHYLQGGPLLPTQASYRAEEAPSLPQVQDFSDAVQSDRTLSPERKRELMKLIDEK